jgi:tripartite-type tricarboxylate transporter receptor subunit TctC
MKVFAMFHALALALVASLATAPAWAQGSYPEKPIQLIVPQTAGGGADILARTIAVKLSQSLGKQVVVDNRAGAAGIIGTQAVAQAAPDGYTLLMGAISTHSMNPGLYKKRLPYDPVKDFVPVSLVASAPLLVVVHPSVPAKSVQELIALAKAQPGKLNFSSAGSGNSTHLAGELFKLMAGVDMVHVPYKGATPAEIGLMGGQVSVMFSSILSALPHSKAGKMKALAVTSAARSSVAPHLPTVAESGLPGYDVNPWYGLFAPAGTPPEIVNKLSREVARIVQLPDVKERFATLGAEPVGNSPQEFKLFLDKEIDKWTKVIDQSGTTAD